MTTQIQHAWFYMAIALQWETLHKLEFIMIEYLLQHFLLLTTPIASSRTQGVEQSKPSGLKGYNT